MVHELWFYQLILILAGLLSTSLGLYAHIKMKDAPGVSYFKYVTLFSAIFTFSYAFELSSTSLFHIKLWLSMEYLVLPFLPVFILLMCLDYNGQKLKQRIYYMLFVIPIMTIFLHSTNDLHHFYYRSVGLRSDTPFPVVKLEWGPWFYVHYLFLFLCLMISIMMLLKQFKKSLFRFRMQLLFMIVGIITPIFANFFYLNKLSPYGIDLGPVSMSLSYFFFAAALLSYQMFNVAPIARDTVFESMKEGIIVLNQNDCIVDFNDMVRKIIPTLAIGKPILDVLGFNRKLADIISLEQECDFESELSHFHIRFSPVFHKNESEIGKIISFVDVTERVILQEKLKELASVDGLTQVYNRTFFFKKFESTFEQLLMQGGKISLIMFDIDHFKNINDTYGHEAGDLVLKQIPKIVKELTRSKDIVGRYGGEEFIICLPDAEMSEAKNIASSIRERISNHAILFNGHEIFVTSSFGISSANINPLDDNQSINTLVREADQALYEAKNSGRNHVKVYEKVV
jgi:diguanylate cyclase (GGDEF)-like protein